MRQMGTSQKRPLVAYLLGATVTGLGHVYLQRYPRATGWLLIAIGASQLIPLNTSVGVLATGSMPTLLVFVPNFVVRVLSLLDLYQLVNGRSRPKEIPQAESDGTITCHNCGREVDPQLSFCQWCSTPLADQEG